MITDRLLIYGHGAMARVMYEALIDHEWLIEGFIVAADLVAPGFRLLGRSVMVEPSQIPLPVAMAVGPREMNATRAEIGERLLMRKNGLISFAHRTATVPQCLHAGVVMLEHSSAHAGVFIDRGVFISSNCNLGHDSRIEAWAWLNAGVCMGGGVTVGERCVLGMNATIAEGVKLAPRTFVGANTLVTRDTQPDEVVISPPGQTVPMRSTDFMTFKEKNK